MAWTSLNAAPQWNVTDLDLLKLLQYATLENGNADATGTPTTSMFTQQEWLAALNQRHQQLLRDTACVLIRASESTTPGTPRYALPPDWIHTRRLSWQAQAAGSKAYALVRSDAYQLDHGMSDWQSNTADPVAYNDGSDLPTLTVELGKAPVQSGTMLLSYVAQPATLTGAGVKLTVPDEYAGALYWGALADLLSSDGESFDPERAEYCDSMYELHVEMINALLSGSTY